jgi:hypothetical protein
MNADRGIVAGIEGGHPLGHSDGIQRDPRMIVITKVLLRELRNGAVAERGAFGAAGYDPNVLHSI